MITPNLFLNAATDDEMIQKAVNKANKKKTYVNIPKYNKRTNSNIWIITKAILLNSNSKIILNGCHLRMADNVFTNMFKNSNCDYYGDVLDKRQRNIKIIGKNNPLLDGGEYNGLSERNSFKKGLPSIRENNLIRLSNVENIKISNLSIKDQRYWGLCFTFCSKGTINYINFSSAGNVPNQDGIDLRLGCHDFVIKNITGCTGDDVIALTALADSSKGIKHEIAGLKNNIWNIKIKHVHAYGVCGNAMIRLLNHDHRKIYNIKIKDVLETSPYSKNDLSVAVNPDSENNLDSNGLFKVKKPTKVGENGYRLSACIRLGEQFWFKNEKGQLGDIYNINIKNVKTHARFAIAVLNNLIDSKFKNINIFGNGFMAVYFGEGIYENLTFNNIRYQNPILLHKDDEKIDIDWNNVHTKGYFAIYGYKQECRNVVFDKVEYPFGFDGLTNIKNLNIKNLKTY